MTRAVPLLALVVLGVLPAPADAARDPSFRGLTGQDRTVLIDSDSEGKAETLRLTWRAKCSSGFRLRAQESVFGPADGTAAAGLRGTERYRFPDRGGRIAHVTMRLNARLYGPALDPAKQLWRGTFRVTVSVRRHGRLSERCALRTSFLAKPEGVGPGTWLMNGGGDWVGSTRVWSYDPTNAVVSAMGEPGSVTIQVDAHDGTSWEAWFKAPALNRLTRGQRYTTDGSTPGAADMRVSGDGRGCNSSGSFTVADVKFDRLGRLVAIKVDYEHFCDGANPGPSRGTVEWRSAA